MVLGQFNVVNEFVVLHFKESANTLHLTAISRKYR